MMENTVGYALHAQTTGLADLQMFRAELVALKELQGGFRSDMGFGQQQRESIKATSVDLSGLEFQILGLTDSIKVLDTTMDKLATKAPSTGGKLKEPFRGLDPIIADTVRSVRTLLTEFQSGNIKAGEFNAGMQKAKATLIQLRTENSLGTRELQAISGALNIVAKSYGEANTASSPYLVGLKAQRAAMNEVRTTSTALNQEILNARRAWQEGKLDGEGLVQVMTSLGIRANALLAPLQAQKAAILALGVPTREQVQELQRLELQITGFAQAAQRAAAGVDAGMGRITRGSLAAGVQSGLAGLDATLKATISDTQRLIEAEKAHMITREQAVLGLTDQVNAQRAALRAMQDEANSLRLLGVLDVQQTERLRTLEVGQQGYTRALAGTTAALEAQVKAQQAAAAAALRTQEQQQSAQRAAMGSALGIRGAGGMNNASMAAMFISPELGMAAMAASMGPVVAAAAAVGLLAKAIGDGIDKAALFERSLQQIGAISGESAAQMNHFGSFVQDLSTKLPISTQQLAEMGREAVMVGLHGPEGMRVYTETMAAFSVVTRDVNGNLGHTAEVGQEVVKILRSTGANTEEVTVGFGRMINGLIGLKTESGVAIPQVTALLKFWSSQGHAVGLTIEQMTGLSAALIQTGARAQGAGGAMARFFDTAESAAAAGGKKLQAWADVIGLSAEKTKELLKNDPMEFLRRFVTGAQDLDHSGKALSLTLGSVDLNSAQVRRTMAELNNALPLVTGNIKIMTSASNDQGLALRKAMEATDDYKDKLALISHAWDIIKQNMGVAVLPGMTAVAAWALDFSKNLMNASAALDNILKATGMMQGKPDAMPGIMPTNKTTVNLDGLNPAQVTKANNLMAQITAAVAAQSGQKELAGRLSGIPWVGEYLKMLAGDGSIDTTTGKIGALTKQLNALLDTAKKTPFIGPLNNQQQYLAGTQPRGFTPDKAAIIARAAKELGVNPNDLAQIIAAETGGTFDPSTRNRAGSGGTGLIQFMPSTAPGLGTTTAALANMSFEQQMEYVIKYFRARPDFHPGASLGDLYSAVGGSGYKKGTPQYDKNALWDTNGNGVIDRGEAVKSPWFQSFAAQYFKPSAGTPGGGGDAPPKGAAAYLKEAERIQNAIDQAQKKGGAAGLTAYTAAKKELELFTKDNADAAAAVAYLSTQTKAAAKVQTEATKDAAQIRKSLAQGSVTDAQTALEKLKTIQQAQLDNAGDSQIKRLAVVRQTSKQIYQAELDIAEATRKAAYANVADEANPDVKRQAELSADKAYALTKQKATLEQAQALASAQKSADSEATQRAREQRDTLARLTSELRQGNVQKAQDELAKLGQLRERDVQAAKDNVARKLAIATDYGQKEYDAAVRIATAIRDKALADAANSHTLNTPKDNLAQEVAETAARRAYDLAVGAAANARSAAIAQATKDQTSAVQQQRKAYSELAGQVREAIKDGGMDVQARRDLTDALDTLNQETDKLGLTNNRYVDGARKATLALVDQSDAVHGSLDVLGESIVQTNDLLDGLDTRLEGLSDAAQTVLELKQAALAAGVNPDATMGANEGRDSMPVSRPEDATARLLATIGIAPDAFVDLARSTIPDALMENTTPETYAQLGVTVLQGLVDGLQNVPGWEKVQSAMQAGLNQAMSDTSFFSNAPSVPGIRTGNERSDYAGFGSQADPGVSDWQKNLSQLGRSDVINGLKDLDEATLQATADFAAGVEDIELYNAALAEIKTRATAAKTALEALPAARLQVQLNTLDRTHASGRSTPESERTYANEREQLQRALENAQYAVSSAKLTGAALEAAQLQHEDRLTQIHADGEAARTAIDQKATTQAADKTEAFMAAQKLMSDGYRALGQAQGETAGPNQALIDQLSSLSTVAGIDQTELAGLITKLKELDQQTKDRAGLDSFISGIESLGQAFGGTGTAAGAALTSIGGALKLSQSITAKGGLFDQTKAAFSAGGSIFDKLGAAGGWLGAISTGIGLIGSLGDAIMGLSPAYQLWKKNTLEQASAEQAAAGSRTYGNIANPYFEKLQADAAALTTKANAGFWQQLGWAIFGGAPETLSKAASDSLVKSSNLFADYAQAINQSLETELMNAFDTADFTGVQDSLDKMFGKLEASIALKSLIAKSSLAADIQQLVDDTAAGLDTTADKARIRADESTITQQFQAIAPSFAGYGASASTTGTTTGSSGTTFGAVPPAIQLAISTPLMDAATLYDTATKRFDTSTLRDEATAVRNEATAARFEAAVSRISDSSSSTLSLR